MEDLKLLENVKQIEVVAIKKGFDGERRVDAGVRFLLKEKEGLDANKKKRLFSVKDQFSSEWMEIYKGKKVNITVEGDFDEDEEEVIIVKKDKNKKKKDQAVAGSNQEVI